MQIDIGNYIYFNEVKIKEDIDKINKSKYSLNNKVKRLIIYSRNNIINSIPKIHTDIRIKYTDELYALSKNILYASYNKGNIRMKYLIEIQTNISFLDMLLDILNTCNIIKKHNIEATINYLSDIKNIIYGWKYNEEKTK